MATEGPKRSEGRRDLTAGFPLLRRSERPLFRPGRVRAVGAGRPPGRESYAARPPAATAPSSHSRNAAIFIARRRSFG